MMTAFILLAAILASATLFNLFIGGVGGYGRIVLCLLVISPVFFISFAVGVFVLDLPRYYALVGIPFLGLTVSAVRLGELLD